jgi:salicylate hydroxylase
VGGGLGGLAAANALAKFDIDFEIFEQAPTLGEVGAGIHVSPQAVKALIGAGINHDELIGAATRSQGIFTRDLNTGEPIFYADVRNAPAKYGAPFLAFHRADLLDLLAKCIDTSRLYLGHQLTHIEEDASEIALRFTNGSTHRADVVIGADGVHSVVRRILYGEDKPTFTGQMVWRSLLPGSSLPPEILEPSGHVRWVGAGRQFYSYYLRKGAVISIVTQQQSEKWVEESWSLAGDPDEMRASFPDPEPRLEKLLSKVTACSKWGIFLRAPTENWGRDRIQLIGDAAHAMLPNAGQGACQAFEDGYVLARWLTAEKDPSTACSNFRRVRMPRVHAVQNRSALNASAKRLPTAEERKAAFREAGLAAAGAMEWIYVYDPVSDWKTPGSIPDRAPPMALPVARS